MNYRRDKAGQRSSTVGTNKTIVQEYECRVENYDCKARCKAAPLIQSIAITEPFVWSAVEKSTPIDPIHL